MGYQTCHTLEVDDNNLELHKKQIGELSGYDCRNWLWEDEAKWYDHEEHMRNYSKAHPTTLFTLTGNGEETDDNWIEYHRNGKMQRCDGEIVYPKFNEGEMK